MWIQRSVPVLALTVASILYVFISTESPANEKRYLQEAAATTKSTAEDGDSSPDDLPKHRKTAENSCASLPTGEEIYLTAKHSNKVLTIFHASDEQGANLVQYSKVKAPNQVWKLKAGRKDGYYEIKSVSSGLNVHVAGVDKYAEGASIVQWAPLAEEDDWCFMPTDVADEYKIINLLNKKLISVEHGSVADNYNIHQWTDLDRPNQIWKVEFVPKTAERSCASLPMDQEMYLTAKHSNKALTVYHASSEQGENLVQYSNVKALNQVWKLKVGKKDGYYEINSVSSGFNVHVAGVDKYAEGASIIQWAPLAEEDDWCFMPTDVADEYKIINLLSKKLLSVEHGSDDDDYNIHQWTDLNRPNQIWKVEFKNPQGTGGGANGDPIIMGLSGQIFKFDGRSGGWYSFISTPSFQWNVKLRRFAGCPRTSDRFITGIGLITFGGENGDVRHQIELNVKNETDHSMACGFEEDGANKCLGMGNLEVFIDGEKFSTTHDHTIDDGSVRVISYNTVAACSRRWWDFDRTPKSDIGVVRDGLPGRVARRGRRLGDTEEPTKTIFDVLDKLKDNVIDKEQCEPWILDRTLKNDIFKRHGTWSTIIIETPKLSLHIEYKQEIKRCQAHEMDVWISRVDQDALEEKWAGVLGETKNSTFVPNGVLKSQEREEALKFPDDEAYEVDTAFSTTCRGGCISRGLTHEAVSSRSNK